MPAEELDALRDQAEAELEASDIEEFELWPENELPLRVFQHCEMPATPRQDGRVQYGGIQATEIRAACELLGVPRDDWPAVIEGVRVCVAAVLPRLNGRGEL